MSSREEVEDMARRSIPILNPLVCQELFKGYLAYLDSLASGSVPESAGTAGSPSPGTSANSDGGKVVLWEGEAIVESGTSYPSGNKFLEISCENPPESWAHGIIGVYHVAITEPAVTPAQAPVLPTAESSEHLPTSTNQEKIPASQDPEGKEK